MKKSLLLATISVLLISTITFAQPANDNFANAIDVTSIINSCSGNAAYTTVDATMDKSQGSCNNGSGYNVWFKFTATAAGTMNVKLDRGGAKGTMQRANIAIWDATGNTQLACNRYVNNGDDVEVAALSLTSGSTYYISIDNNYSGYKGTFTLCLNETPNYDYYEGAVDVSAFINGCSPNKAYTTVGATMDKSQGSCNNGSGYNRWFKFTATGPIMNIKVDRGGGKGNIKRINLAVWQSDGVTPVNCNRYVSNNDDVETAALGLTTGNVYYISVDNNYSGYRGDFTLCLEDSASYDYYEGALDVTSLIGTCTPAHAYTTVGATMDKAQGSCNNGSGYNRWFKFTANQAMMNFKVQVGGGNGTMRRANIALWEADGTTQVACNRYVSNDDDVEIAALTLTPGNVYYISIDNNYSGYRGDFKLCIDTTVSYDYYEGAKDVSAYIGSCSPDAAYTTLGATMDKAQGSCNNGTGYNRWFKFTATHTIMNFKVDRGGAKGSMKRANIALWESNGTTQVACNRYVSNNDDVEIAATSLTIGNTYYISVDNNYSGYRGTFTLCVDTTASYDYYEGSKDISAYIGTSTPNKAYTTVGATMDKAQGSCNNGSGYNRWFKFQATTPYLNLTVDRGGSKGTIKRVNAAVWESDGSTQVACNRYVSNDDDVNIDMVTLTIGNWYYLSVDNNYSGYRGTFTISLDNTPSYDFYEGAIEFTDLNNWKSANKAYTTIGATMDKAQGSCNNGSGYNRWFKFTAIDADLTYQVLTAGSQGTVKRLNTTLWEADGTTQVACARYLANDDDLVITYSTIIPGNVYYISVDNNYSGYRGTFTMKIDNVGDKYYSRANGNWATPATWSLTSHTGAAAPTTPGAGDIVFVNGNAVTVTGVDSCAELTVRVSKGASSLTIDGGSLTTMGTFNFWNFGHANLANVSLINGGDLTINDNFIIIRKAGGTQPLQIVAGTGSNVSVNQKLDIKTLGGTGTQNSFTFNGNSTLSVGDNTSLRHTAGVASELIFNNTSTGEFFGAFKFTGAADNMLLVSVNNSASLTFHNGVTKSASGYGAIHSLSNSTLNFVDFEPSTKFPNENSSGTTDAMVYANVVFTSINPTTNLILDSAFTFNGNLSLNSLMGITVKPTGAISVTGSISNNGSVTINPGGSLVQTHAGTSNVSGSGSFAVKQTGQGSNMAYNIWSSPIENAGIFSSFTGVNPCDVYVVNAATQEWKYDYASGYSTTCNGNPVTFASTDVIAGGDAVMDDARGYFVPGASSATRTFSGTVNDGDMTIPIYGNNVIGTPAVDWVLSDQNLVGNPYPSGLDLSTFWTANSSNLQGGIHFYDHTTTSYVTWTSGGGTGPDNVAVAQGFWVEADASAFTAPAPNNLVFNNAMRSTSVDAFYKTENVNHNIVLSINSPSGLSARMLVGYHANATDDVDKGYDARVFGANPNLKFASVLDGKDFVVQNVDPISFGGQKVFPLTVFTTETGTHTFIEYKRENLNVDVYIRDNQTGTVHNINDGDYSVSLVANQDYSGRFDIVFVNTATQNDDVVTDNGKDQTDAVTSIEDAQAADFVLLTNAEGYTLVNNDGINGNIQVIDVTGKVVWTKNNVHANQVNITLDGVSTGIYFINIINNGEKVYNNKVVKN